MNDEDKNYENLIQMALDNLKGQAQYDFIIYVLKDERAKAKEEAQKEFLDKLNELVLESDYNKEGICFVGDVEKLEALKQFLSNYSQQDETCSLDKHENSVDARKGKEKHKDE